MTQVPEVPPGVDPDVPSPVRLYDYFLGGTNHFPVDQEAGEALRALIPDIDDAMWANRGFHGRAALWMADHGIRQFIDLGSGLPTQNNTHQAVQKVSPGARVVYVDHDPMVAARSGPLLASRGTTALVTADWRDPDAVLGDPGLRRLIDFAQPAGVLMTTQIHFTPDEDDPWGLVARYMAAVAPGSYLALAHGTYDKIPPHLIQAGRQTYEKATEQIHLRSRPEVERFFAGLELVPPYEGADPGLTFAGLWGAEDIEAADTEGSRGIYCGVARRP
jgi:S-adenosyl methyltransferase